jgi:hypothetical protein
MSGIIFGASNRDSEFNQGIVWVINYELAVINPIPCANILAASGLERRFGSHGNWRKAAQQQR